MWIIWVDGKTGRRGIPIFKSIKYLNLYLEEQKLDPNSDMWIANNTGVNKHRKGEKLRYIGLSRMLNRCFERAHGIPSIRYAKTDEEKNEIRRKKKLLKQHNPHFFRHSRASLLAGKLSQAMLCDFFGWSKSSKMVSVYAHTSVKQVVDAVGEFYNVKTPVVEEEKPKYCKVCNELNGKTSKYCYKCGAPLTLEKAMEDRFRLNRETELTMEAYNEIMSNKKLFEEFKLFKKWKEDSSQSAI